VLTIEVIRALVKSGLKTGVLKTLKKSNPIGYKYLVEVEVDDDSEFEWGDFLGEFTEEQIAKYSSWSLIYAENVLGDRFELGEPTIAKEPRDAMLYARDIISGRFELGEPAIASDGHSAYLYAKWVLRGRFEAGEEAIALSADTSYHYAVDVLKKRFKLGERAIATHATANYHRAYLDKFPSATKTLRTFGVK